MKIFKKPFKKSHFGGTSSSGAGGDAARDHAARDHAARSDLPPISSGAAVGELETARPAVPPAGDRADYYSSEEEFQVQLALALSASNSDFGVDPDGDQIRAATLLSLGGQGVRQDREEEGTAESLSRRYWDYNVLDYKEKVIDGFYDIFGLSSNSAGQGKMPSLVDLQTGIGDLGFEVIVVNRAIDPQLVELEQIAHCVSLDCPAAQVAVLVQRISELIMEHMGGPVRDANDMLMRWMEKSTELRASQQTSLLPIGCIKVGLSRHRALLFKVLADNIGIPCRLVKGSHYTGIDDDAVNIIKLDNEREFLVDLMAAPGTLIPIDVFSTKDAPTSSWNSRMNSLTPWTMNNSDNGVLRLEPSYGEYKGNNGNSGTSVLDDNSVTDKRSPYEKVLGPSIPSAHTVALLTSAESSSNGIMSMLPLNQENQSSSSTSAISAKQKGVLKIPVESDNVRNGSSTDESRDLFAELSPFQAVGLGKASAQLKASGYKNNEYQRRRENIPSGPGRPQLPLVWKNRSPCNEVLNAKSSNIVDGLLPRKNMGMKDINTSSSSYPFSPAGKINSDVPNTNVAGVACTSYSSEVGTSDNEMIDALTGNIGYSSSGANCSSIEGTNQQRKFDNSNAFISIQSSGEKAKEENSTNGLVLPINMVNKNKEQRRHMKGKNDTNRSAHEVMSTNLVYRDSESSSTPSQAMPSRLDPMLDDVAECEIPWEDLEIGERIGLGSYGEVYRADWNGKEVAVKKFLDQDFYGDALDEFRSEVRIMRRLRHPNVVCFMGAVTRPPNLSIVSEFLPRGSLYRILHRSNSQTDEKRRIKMALDVAKGMSCLHTSIPTIVHRDLKSPNLLVDKNWTVKVCDFGLSRLKHSTFLSSKSTAGTPEWMAPEVLRNEPSNEKCDVYSFGVILWELATLRMPWSGMNPMQVVGAVGFQERRLDIPKEVDPIVARIIWECWQTDPSLRPSFAQLTTALKSLQRLVVPTYQDTPNPPLSQEISVNSTP